MVKSTRLTTAIQEFEEALGESRVLLLPFEPVAASRPRINMKTGGVFYPPNHTKFHKTALAYLKAHCESAPFSEAAIVIVEVVKKAPKKGKYNYPKVGDVDNYAKLPLDVTTQANVAWDDDNQITHLFVMKRYQTGDEEPHVKVKIWEIED